MGHAPHNMPSKNFLKKITSSKIEKFLVLIFAVKTVQIDLILSQGERETVFRPKNDFEIFRFSDLENFQKFFKILVKILNFFNNFL